MTRMPTKGLNSASISMPISAPKKHAKPRNENQRGRFSPPQNEYLIGSHRMSLISSLIRPVVLHFPASVSLWTTDEIDNVKRCNYTLYVFLGMVATPILSVLRHLLWELQSPVGAYGAEFSTHPLPIENNCSLFLSTLGRNQLVSYPIHSGRTK